MSANDARFWDRTARKYAASAIADQAGYDRTLDRTRARLKPDDRVLELGCGTGTTALKLAAGVRSYLATDLSAGMIAIADERRAATPIPALAFRCATAEALAHEGSRFDVVLGFNFLHLVRDLPATLGAIRDLLVPGGLFVSKTPCVGDMNALVRLGLLPVMRAIGKAPHVGVFGADELHRAIAAAGFQITATEGHASRGRDVRPYIVARNE